MTWGGKDFYCKFLLIFNLAGNKNVSSMHNILYMKGVISYKTYILSGYFELAWVWEIIYKSQYWPYFLI